MIIRKVQRSSLDKECQFVDGPTGLNTVRYMENSKVIVLLIDTPISQHIYNSVECWDMDKEIFRL
jgi:hypothetical protein